MKAMPDADERKTILVVEDEDVLIELLRGMLEVNGFNVLTARDGGEAVKTYRDRQKEIAVVLTDMGLPTLGGWDVLEQVLKINPAAKVICASGFLENSIREEMLQAGAVEFIQKPYAYENLLSLIRGLCASGQ